MVAWIVGARSTQILEIQQDLLTNTCENEEGEDKKDFRVFVLGIGTARLLSPHMNMASLVAQLVKHLPAMQETLVRFLGWEDPLEKGKATHSSILAQRSPWTV